MFYFVLDFIEEATAHFRKAFPDLVRINEESILFAFGRMFRIFIKQRCIDNDVRIFTYTEDGIDSKKKDL